MLTVALVGGDGAGKTTIAKSLEKSSLMPIKYLYMGPSVMSDNLALPTSLLARLIKIRFLKKASEESEKSSAAPVSSHDFHYKLADRSVIWLAARLLNRLAEASYRHFLSLIYQWLGYVMIYDRYFLYDACPDEENSQVWKDVTFERLEYFFFYHFFPKPNLVIFLDAPAGVLYTRKKESSIQYLDRRRKLILELGKKMTNFVVVDAAQPFDKVLAEVKEYIARFYIRYNRRKMSSPNPGI
jgi:thymidylate kinase